MNALDAAGTDWTNKRSFRMEQSIEDLERKVKNLKKAKITKPSNKSLKAASKQGHNICQKVGCNNKIERYKPGFKLCTSCVLECVEKKKDAPLKGGGVWKRRSKEAKRVLRGQRNKAARARKRAHRAESVDDGERDDDDDDEEPEPKSKSKSKPEQSAYEGPGVKSPVWGPKIRI